MRGPDSHKNCRSLQKSQKLAGARPTLKFKNILLGGVCEGLSHAYNKINNWSLRGFGLALVKKIIYYFYYCVGLALARGEILNI